MNESIPTRPAVRYHGGKWKLSPWIIEHFPKHRIYVEPYGGGASVLLRKSRSYAEVYNDLDGEICNLFRIMRDKGEELKRLLELTPFARDEYLASWKPAENDLEQARRTIVRSFMGFGSAAITLAKCSTDSYAGGICTTGFRANSNRSGSTPAHDWANYPKAMCALIERLRGVVIENRDAAQVIVAHDTPETLHYIDPPYVPATRDKGQDYRYEMSEDDHIELANVLHNAKGYVVISGYPSDLYDEIYKGWLRFDRRAFADGAAERVECLWLNKKAAAHQRQHDLFREAM